MYVGYLHSFVVRRYAASPAIYVMLVKQKKDNRKKKKKNKKEKRTYDVMR